MSMHRYEYTIIGYQIVLSGRWIRRSGEVEAADISSVYGDLLRNTCSTTGWYQVTIEHRASGERLKHEFSINSNEFTSDDWAEICARKEGGVS